MGFSVSATCQNYVSIRMQYNAEKNEFAWQPFE